MEIVEIKVERLFLAEFQKIDFMISGNIKTAQYTLIVSQSVLGRNKYCNLTNSSFSQNKPEYACRKCDRKGETAPKAGSYV